MSEDWAWKMISFDPFGPVFAQVREVTVPGRHFLVRRVCAIKGKDPKTGKWVVGPHHLPLLAELSRGDLTVYPSAVHFISEMLPGNVEALEGIFKSVKAATPGEADAEVQKRNRLLHLGQGQNGG